MYTGGLKKEKRTSIQVPRELEELENWFLHPRERNIDMDSKWWMMQNTEIRPDEFIAPVSA